MTFLKSWRARGAHASIATSRAFRSARRVAIGGGTLAALIAIWDCAPESKPPLEAPNGTVAVSMSPTSARIAQGSSAPFTVTVTRNEYSGPVTLRTESMPEGLTIAFSPSVIPAGSATATATITAAPNAPYSFTNGELTERTVVVLAEIPGAFNGASTKIAVAPSSSAGVTATVAPGTFRLAPGGNVQGTVTIGRQGNYTGQVALSVEGAPTGVTASVTPAGAADSWTLQLTAAPNAPEDSRAQTLTLVASPQGLAPVRTTFLLTVQRPGFSLQFEHGELVSAPGGEDDTPVNVNRTGGLTGAITLSVEPLPSGFTASLSSTSVVDQVSTLTVRTTSAVSPGTYPITVRAVPPTGSGLATQTKSINYRVTGPAAAFSLSASNVTLSAGNSILRPVVINRSANFTAPVTLLAARSGGGALPAGMTVDPVNPTSPTENGAIIIYTTSQTPPGVYPLTITGSAPGSGNATVDIDVTVVARRATSIALVLLNGNPAADITLPRGSSVVVQPIVRDQDDQLMVNEPVTWATSDPSVVTVTPAGSVNAIGTGNAFITATVTSAPTVRATATVRVTTAASNVVRIEIEPKHAEVTYPARQQFTATLFDAPGARVSPDENGEIVFVSSNTSVAEVAPSGLVTTKGGGTPTITAQYKLNGSTVLQDATPLLVYAPTQGHYGSVTLSTQGNTRDVRRGGEVYAQLIIRDVNGVQLVSGISPEPEIAASAGSNVQIVRDTNNTGGYFYFIRAAQTAPLGAFTIRYDVRGAGGQITMSVVAQ